MLKCWIACRNTEILKYWNAVLLKHWNAEILAPPSQNGLKWWLQSWNRLCCKENLNHIVGIGIIAEWVNLVYWWSCIGKGLQQTGLPRLVKMMLRHNITQHNTIWHYITRHFYISPLHHSYKTTIWHIDNLTFQSNQLLGQ